MKTLLHLLSLFLFVSSFGQGSTRITGTVVDENRKPVMHAAVHYNHDTTYTDEKGQFSVLYPSHEYFYFHFVRKDYLPKSFFARQVHSDTILQIPIVIRSRKNFWYDAHTIDSTHLGITVKEAIVKYKLDAEQCIVWDEPPGKYHTFTAELGDSSYLSFTFQGIFSKEKRIGMEDILDRKITGIGIAFTDGTEKEIGVGRAWDNPYFIEGRRKAGNR
jgi:hypothetical protein